jgi:branched-chain amino acid transport system permease protein
MKPSLPPVRSAAAVDGKALPYATIAVLVIVALLLPTVLSGYRTFQVTNIVIYSIALLGLNMLTGYNGQISIGHGAFYGLGAYTAAILMVRFGVPYFLTIPAAGAVCLVAGFLFGLPALRLGRAYLALATFALAVVMPQLLKYKVVEPWTGATLGLTLNKPDVPFALPIGQDQWLYYVSLGVALPMFLLARNLLTGRIGNAMMAVRDQPIAAAAVGIDTAMLKSVTFGVSAMYTGIAGALSAIVAQYVAPDSYNFFLSISFLVGIVVGGVGTITGAIYGAIFIGLVPDFAGKLSKAAPWAVYGSCLIACVYLMPSGIHGVVRLLQARIRRAGRRAGHDEISQQWSD